MRAIVLIGFLAAVAAAACGASAAHPAPAPIENMPGPEPPPVANASCGDAIAGTWRTRVFRGEVSKVDEVTLTVIRSGLTELRGQIVVETWDVDESDDEPPTCPDGAAAISRVVQSAGGWIHGGEFDFAGSDPERTVVPCGLPPGGIYNPDHFTGELDGTTLVTTNDDGGSDKGRPHRFTRIGCAP